MGLSPELKKIKKRYGEKFALYCRDNFPTILEEDGKLFEILKAHFAFIRSIYESIVESDFQVEFNDYINNVYEELNEKKDKKEQIDEDIKSPYEILDEAGYELIECNSEEEIQSFKKWYAPGEVICTISNGGRLYSHIVFFAINKNAAQIKREEFQNPKREDNYGKSVLGIQFNKYGRCLPHIISRYNHTVDNPNATFGNNLNKIAPNLQESFKQMLKDKDLELEDSNIEDFELPGYTVAGDGKYYKYNIEVDGKYYCENNVIIDNGKVIKYDKEKYIVLDNFILDLENKQISLYDKIQKDSFIDGLKNINKIDIKNEKDKKVLIISLENKKDVKIELDKSNNIIGYEDKNIENVGDRFLCENEKLRKLNLPNLKKIANDFLYSNEELLDLNLPNVEEIGKKALYWNGKITDLNLSKIRKIDDKFLYQNQSLKRMHAPNLEEVGDEFLYNSIKLNYLVLLKLRKVGNEFLRWNRGLRRLEVPELKEVGNNFLSYNTDLEHLSAENLKKVGACFLLENIKMRKLNLPNLEESSEYFMNHNRSMEELNLPKLKNKYVLNSHLLKLYRKQMSKINSNKKELEIDL